MCKRHLSNVLFTDDTGRKLALMKYALLKQLNSDLV